VTPAFSYKA